jgi:hypothetical protein
MAEEIFTIQSNWITEKEAQWLETLMTSPEVYILDVDDNAPTGGDYKLPIIIQGNNYEVKTTMRDKIFNFVLNYKMAFPKNLQND